MKVINYFLMLFFCYFTLVFITFLLLGFIVEFIYYMKLGVFYIDIFFFKKTDCFWGSVWFEF